MDLRPTSESLHQRHLLRKAATQTREALWTTIREMLDILSETGCLSQSHLAFASVRSSARPCESGSECRFDPRFGLEKI
jgi:hypothetical protein